MTKPKREPHDLVPEKDCGNRRATVLAAVAVMMIAGVTISWRIIIWSASKQEIHVVKNTSDIGVERNRLSSHLIDIGGADEVATRAFDTVSKDLTGLVSKVDSIRVGFRSHQAVQVVTEHTLQRDLTSIQTVQQTMQRDITQIKINQAAGQAQILEAIRKIRP